MNYVLGRLRLIRGAAAVRFLSALAHPAMATKLLMEGLGKQPSRDCPGSPVRVMGVENLELVRYLEIRNAAVLVAYQSQIR